MNYDGILNLSYENKWILKNKNEKKGKCCYLNNNDGKIEWARKLALIRKKFIKIHSLSYLCIEALQDYI